MISFRRLLKVSTTLCLCGLFTFSAGSAGASVNLAKTGAAKYRSGKPIKSIKPIDRLVARVSPKDLHLNFPKSRSIGDDLVAQGKDRLQNQDWDGAINFFNQALAKDSTNSLALAGRGWAQFNSGRYNQALADGSEAINAATTNNQQYGFAYTVRACALNGATQNQQLDQNTAIQLLTQSIDDLTIALQLNAQQQDVGFVQNPDSVNYAMRALDNNILGNYLPAAQDADLALQKDKTLTTLWAIKANCDLNLMDTDGAIRDCSHGIDANPTNVDIDYYVRGHSYLQIDRFKEALADLNQAVNLSGGGNPAKASFQYLQDRCLANVTLNNGKAALDDANCCLAQANAAVNQLEPIYQQNQNDPNVVAALAGAINTLAQAQRTAAYAYESLGDLSSAINQYQQASGSYSQVGNTEESSDMANTGNRLQNMQGTAQK